MNKLIYKGITSIFFLMLLHPAFSQVKATGMVSGKIVDSSSAKQDLSQATVSVTPVNDSTAAQFVFTNKMGAFSMRYLKPANYRLIITFEGYQPIVRKFTISADKPTVDFGTFYMQHATQEMQTVIVQRPPMAVKGDTVEYSAASFATKPNAVAEDLLKKFPGIQVDASGNITAQGETVQRVLVDGKRFFSDDPKLATRNLPPDIIDKVQVFDDLDDQSKFSGFDNGNRVKTINITTKKDKRKGNFGRTIAGIGTDEDYDASVNMHHFSGDEQISVLGQGNDVNKQNFTIQDILGGGGGGGRGGRGPAAATNQSSPGVTTVWAGGGNYKNTWGGTDLTGSYFYNFQHVSLNTQSQQGKFISATNSDTVNALTQAFQRTTNQRIYFNLEHKFDTSNSLVFRPNFTYQSTSPNSSSSSAEVDQSKNPLYSTNGYSRSTNSGYNINGSNLTLRHRFKKKYRTISLDITGNANANNGSGYNYSINNQYISNRIDSLNQYYNDSLHSYSISPTLSYTEPLGKNTILEFNYNYNHTHSTTINNTYDYSNVSQSYKNLDSLFSNSYRLNSNSNRFTLNYRIQNAKYNLTIGSGIQLLNFDSRNITKDIDVNHQYVNLTPTAIFQYSISKTSRLRVFYQGRTGSPSANQLQPLTTTSDSINYTVGNPALKPQFTHSLRLLYNSFDPGTQRVIFATVNASTTVNDIQSAIVNNSSGGQTSTYVNLNGTYNVSGFFTYGFALKKPKSNLNFTTGINYSQNQNLVDTLRAPSQPYVYVSDYTKNMSLSETVSWTTNIKKNFDMNFSYAPTYNIARNTLQPNQNLNYFSQIFTAEFTAYTNSGWLVAANFNYTNTNNRTPGYNASIPLLSPSIAKSLFKKKNGEIRFTVFDILNSNTYVNKNVSLTGYTLSKTNTLSRYAMLTFTWNLNKFPSSQQGRMPGMFNNMRPPGGMRGPGGGRDFQM